MINLLPINMLATFSAFGYSINGQELFYIFPAFIIVAIVAIALYIMLLWCLPISMADDIGGSGFIAVIIAHTLVLLIVWIFWGLGKRDSSKPIFQKMDKMTDTSITQTYRKA